MLQDARIRRYTLALAALILFSLNASAQDLGSSTGIFNNPKPKAAPPKVAPVRTAPKKAAIRPAPPKVAPVERASTPRLPRAVKTPRLAVRRLKNTAKENAAINPPAAPPPVDKVIVVGDRTNDDFNANYEKLIEQGNTARDARDYPNAEVAYRQAQNLSGKEARAFYGLGNIYSDQQRWEEAERAYRAALELNPTAPETAVALSFVLTQPIIGANLADRYAEAEKLARQAVELDPKNAFAYDQLGVALELGGKIGKETQDNYRQAIALDPAFALAYAHLGRLLIKLGAVKESNENYSQAIKLAADVPTMILVADVMQSQQKFAESEQLLRRALNADDKNPTALYLLGRALTIGENYAEAETVLKKSAAVSPNSFVSYTLLGSLAARRGKLGEAENYLNQAVKIVSPNEKKRLAQEFEAVGDASLRAGKSKNAARLFRQALALDQEKTTLNDKIALTEKP